MSGNGLRLVVKNLGPIGSADVEVRPLTVLIGKNNTGKTYLAQALYAALRTPENLRPRFTRIFTSDELEQLAKTLQMSSSKDRHGRGEHHVDGSHSSKLDGTGEPDRAGWYGVGSLDSVTLRVGDLPTGIQTKIAEWVGQALRDATKTFEKRLLAYFGEPRLENITRWNHSDTVSVELRNANGDFRYFGTVSTETLFTAHTTDHSANHADARSTNRADDLVLPDIADIKAAWPLPMIEDYLNFAQFQLGGRQVGDGSGPQAGDNSGHTEHTASLFGDGSDHDRIGHELSSMVMAKTWNGYLKSAGLNGSAHYLPAGRSGLLQAWTDVVKLRLELERERYGLPNIPDTSLDGVALDFIGSLAEILGRRRGFYRRHHRHPIWALADFDPTTDIGEEFISDADNPMELLKQIMQGEIDTGSGEDAVPSLEYRQGKNRIPVRRASSMVADLAPLAMWIDRIVQRGDLLVIDEPESHLHPEAIRSVARVLVRLVNQGVRVVCATHSPVLLHELSNSILRDKLSQGGGNPQSGDTRGRGGNPQDDGNPQSGGKPQGGRKAGLNYTEGDVLSFDDIAVYRFLRNDPSEPVEVTRVEIDPDWGIPEDEYVKVATELSDETAHLIDMLS